jgi:hypothetical protein
MMSLNLIEMIVLEFIADQISYGVISGEVLMLM